MQGKGGRTGNQRNMVEAIVSRHSFVGDEEIDRILDKFTTCRSSLAIRFPFARMLRQQQLQGLPRVDVRQRQDRQRVRWLIARFFPLFGECCLLLVSVLFLARIDYSVHVPSVIHMLLDTNPMCGGCHA